MAKKLERFPVFPNWFPFNDMLLDGHLNIGRFGVKTRSWNWDYRGPVLLYNSSRKAHQAIAAYEPEYNRSLHKMIVGIGELVDVHRLSEAEGLQMVLNFNNAGKDDIWSELLNGGISPFEAHHLGYIGPFHYGFFFQNLRRFEEPVSFVWPSGPVKPIFTAVGLNSKLYHQISKVFPLKKALRKAS